MNIFKQILFFSLIISLISFGFIEAAKVQRTKDEPSEKTYELETPHGTLICMYKIHSNITAYSCTCHDINCNKEGVIAGSFDSIKKKTHGHCSKAKALFDQLEARFNKGQ